jgi:hypothetical protein
VIHLTPTPAADGATTAFTITGAAVPERAQVFVDRAFQIPTTDYSAAYTATSFQITFAVAPPAGSYIDVACEPAITPAWFIAHETPAGTANGSNRSFTLANVPYGLQLFVDRALVLPGTDYSRTGRKIAFTSFAPRSGAIIRACYGTTARHPRFLAAPVVPTPAPDGVNLTFALPYAIPQPVIFVDGALATPTTDYSVAGTTLTFTSLATTPRAGASVAVCSSADAPFDVVTAPAETPDGVRQTFTFSSAPALLQLYVEGMLQAPGLDYSLSGAVVTFLTADATPRAGAVVLGCFNRSTAAPLFEHDEAPTGTVDGINSHFTLAYVPQRLQLFVDRILQVPGVDYSRSGAAIAFLTGSVPPAGALLWANYSAAATPFDLEETPAALGGSRWILTRAPASAWVFVDRLLQIPGVDYALSGRQIQFLVGAVPLSGAAIDVCYQLSTAVQSVVSAFPTNWRTMRISISAAPDSAQFPTIAGDALNPACWAISRDDSGASLTPVAVAQVNSTTFDISTAERFPSHLVGMLAGFQNLLFTSVPQTATLDVKGLTWNEYFTAPAEEAQRRRVTTDLANPQASLPGTSNVGGTLALKGGDYVNVTGADLVKKLIYRRLATPKGAFAHLPNYGLGLLTAKQLFQPNDLIKLRAEIERQVKMEPEVSTVRAKISLDPAGILYISVTATLATSGQTVQVSLGGA